MSTSPKTPFTSATLLGLTVLLCPLARAADPLPEGVQVAYCRETLNTLSLSPGINVATVAKVKFFITADGGRTWVLGAEVVQPAASSERPRFPFKVEHDGVYGVMTSVTYRDGRSEVEPRPGQPPQYALVIDSTPPAIARFDATLAGATVNRSVVHCSWSTSDANPAAEPVAVEVSSDDGAHFTPLAHGAAAGSCDLAVPIDPLVKQLLVRLVVSDRAGNVATSAVHPLAVTRPADLPLSALAPAAPAPVIDQVGTPAASAAPPAASAVPAPAPAVPAPAPAGGDAVSEFAQAAKALPALNERGATPPPVLPEIPPVAQDHHPAASSGEQSKASSTAPGAPANAPVAPANAPVAPASAPAAVAKPAAPPLPPAAVAPAAEAAEAPAAGTNAIDQEYLDRQASRHPTPQPHILQRPLPGDEPEPQPRRRHADDGATPAAAGASSLPEAPAPAPAAAPSPWLRRAPAPAPAASIPQHAAALPLPADGQRQPPITAGFVGDAEAVHTIGLARIAASAGRIDDALDFYERLFASSQARTAAAEELQLLTREKRPLDLVIVTDALPRELLTDAVRLEHGRALLALGHPDLALATLTHIGSRAPEAREALLLMAHAYRARGQLKEARTVLEFLARGTDGAAAQATSELGRTGR